MYSNWFWVLQLILKTFHSAKNLAVFFFNLLLYMYCYVKVFIIDLNIYNKFAKFPFLFVVLYIFCLLINLVQFVLPINLWDIKPFSIASLTGSVVFSQFLFISGSSFQFFSQTSFLIHLLLWGFICYYKHKHFFFGLFTLVLLTRILKYCLVISIFLFALICFSFLYVFI